MKNVAIGLMVGAMLAGCGGEGPPVEGDGRKYETPIPLPADAGVDLGGPSDIETKTGALTMGGQIGTVGKLDYNLSFIQQVARGDTGGYGDRTHGWIGTFNGSRYTMPIYFGRDYVDDLNGTLNGIDVVFHTSDYVTPLATYDVTCNIPIIGYNNGIFGQPDDIKAKFPANWNIPASVFNGYHGNWLGSTNGSEIASCRAIDGSWGPVNAVDAYALFFESSYSEPRTYQSGANYLLFEVYFQNVVNRYYLKLTK
jgi:hypothetical protein